MYQPELVAILVLLLVPLLAAVLLAVLNRDNLRTGIVGIASAVIIATSLYLAWSALSGPVVIALEYAKQIGVWLFIVEIAVALAIIVLSLKYRRMLPLVLGAVQLLLICIMELFYAESVSMSAAFVVNDFTAIMVLIIGIIGTLICVYALGYMKDYHHHQESVPQRKAYFFAMLFVFLTAMFGIVLSNSLMWILCFWEVTTLCSFLLIGYSKTPEAVTNSFRAVWMNLVGGIAFTLAIISLLNIDPTGSSVLGITDIIHYPDMAALTIPAALIAIAGLTKAAQMPFSSWLTGAMVAPTPVSALLHSSTMVKAGVYLLVVFAPIFSQTAVGTALAFIGLFTFVITSALAISQSNAKKVLAYSTIANLGLITTCAGIGTPTAVLAAILLIIFHAVAKALLFLCVGAVEHRIDSRDIEDMDGLLVRLPLLATMMVIGICGMYLAPFGMLISKWTAVVAFLSAPFGWAFVIMLAFGSALTIFFWTKWLGKLFMRMSGPPAAAAVLHVSEKIPVVVMGALTIVCCIGFIGIIHQFIDPYLTSIYPGYIDTATVAVLDNVLMLGIMFVILAVLIAAAHAGSKSGRTLAPYLCGRGVDEAGRFRGSLGVYKEAKSSNYYLSEYFGEDVLMKPACIISILIIIVMFVLAFLGVMI
ncbi:NADH-quinone oxidoreductase subunit L [Methanorbis rubei]|uniref:NAD(P)H-quinone oxidoreductase subunit 2, chloroplastic n=1 Tax=Methanorbis rubei TaxID=3028300 RepID=A0AAE4MGV7_9EURY|nr:NAD(P)H-quinone oxidoreductase subunit 2, chloroplastic [Methanocorpusculaceae archaeon Cs1]